MTKHSQIIINLNRDNFEKNRYMRYLDRLSDLKDKVRISEKTYLILKTEYKNKLSELKKSRQSHRDIDQNEPETYVIENEKDVENEEVTIEIE